MSYKRKIDFDESKRFNSKVSDLSEKAYNIQCDRCFTNEVWDTLKKTG